MLSQRAVVGLALIAGGAALGYYVWRQRQQTGGISGGSVADARVTTVPEEPLARGIVQPITATVSWQNPTSQAITYGVQGAVIQAPPLGDPGLVGGHWWASQASLQQAAVAYGGGDRTGRAAAAALAAIPGNRVVTVRVGPGERGTVQLYGQPAIVQGEEWWFWIRTYTGTGLLVSDPVNTHISQLTKEVVHKVRVV